MINCDGVYYSSGNSKVHKNKYMTMYLLLYVLFLEKMPLGLKLVAQIYVMLTYSAQFFTNSFVMYLDNLSLMVISIGLLNSI